MKKNLGLLMLLALVASGCSGEEVSSESGSEATQSQSTSDNLTGGVEVPIIEEESLFIMDTNQDNKLEAGVDDTKTTLEDADFAIDVTTYDSTGDGKIDDESETKEDYTTVVKVKNDSEKDYAIQKFKIYYQSAKDETVEVVVKETGGVDSEKFQYDGHGYLKYTDEDSYNEFVLPAGEELKFVSTQTINVAYEGAKPVLVSFIAVAEGEDPIYIEYKPIVEAT